MDDIKKKLKCIDKKLKEISKFIFKYKNNVEWEGRVNTSSLHTCIILCFMQVTRY